MESSAYAHPCSGIRMNKDGRTYRAVAELTYLGGTIPSDTCEVLAAQSRSPAGDDGGLVEKRQCLPQGVVPVHSR
jgi:hypothetical protein